MEILHVDSFFTNIPIAETIDICTNLHQYIFGIYWKSGRFIKNRVLYDNFSILTRAC